MRADALPQRSVVLRAGLAGTAAWIAALIVLVALVALLLGDAGPDWRATGTWAGTVVMLTAVNALSAGLGGGVGVWQAATGGAQSRREALLAGCGPLVLVATGLTLMFIEVSLGGVVAALGSIVASAAGALAGGVLVARRLDG